ncbi:hypothetical protein ABH924_003629 [Arthrobacter sp. GAS37]|uniref:hypothetical protein n=1 Tax=Arthrobacter sp. GAS37 TaxID=3156261 RepID=UPI003834DC1C
MLSTSVIVNYPGGPDPLWSFLSGAIGAVLGGAAAIVGVLLTQRHENNRNVLTERRRRRDDKLARLRSLYVPYVDFSIVVRQVMTQKAFIYAGETEETRDQRHDEILRTAMNRVVEVQGAAILEDGSEGVLRAAGDAYIAFDTYLRSVRNPFGEEGSEYAQRVRQEADDLAQKADALEQRARDDIRSRDIDLEM